MPRKDKVGYHVQVVTGGSMESAVTTSLPLRILFHHLNRPSDNVVHAGLEAVNGKNALMETLTYKVRLLDFPSS